MPAPTQPAQRQPSAAEIRLWQSIFGDGAAATSPWVDGALTDAWRQHILPRLALRDRPALACTHPLLRDLVLREAEGVARTRQLARVAIPHFRDSDRLEMVLQQTNRLFVQRQRLQRGRPSGSLQLTLPGEVMGLALLSRHGTAAKPRTSWRLVAAVARRRPHAGWCDVNPIEVGIFAQAYASRAGGRPHRACSWNGPPALRAVAENEQPDFVAHPPVAQNARYHFARDGSHRLVPWLSNTSYRSYDEGPASAYAWHGVQLTTAWSATSAARTWALRQPYYTANSRVMGVALSPQAALAALAWGDFCLQLYKNRCIHPYLQLRLPALAVGLCLSADHDPAATRLAVATAQQQVLCYRAQEGSLCFSRRLAATPSCLGFTPDAATLAVGLEDASLQLLRTDDGHLLHKMTTGTAPPRALHFAEDGSALAFGTRNGTVRLLTFWRPEDDAPRRAVRPE